MSAREKKFLEFFAGGGMARLGLGEAWRCAFANDIDSQKRDAYAANFGLAHYHFGDIAALSIDDLPTEKADLAWASFPCQDLSLAGARNGLAGERSSAFFGFWRLISRLARERRAPKTIVIENVPGLLTSNGGDDFHRLVMLITKAGYRASALMLDAELFSPQSRKRIFIFGFADDAAPLLSAQPEEDGFTPANLLRTVDTLPAAARRRWVWLAPRPQSRRNIALADLIERRAPWDPAPRTRALIATMSQRQRRLLSSLRQKGGRHVGAAFKRIRVENGEKTLRTEARFDGISGCLRTPAGGSSRQILIEVTPEEIRSRLMTPREAARLMGLGDDYRLPQSATAALKLCGDGVSVPVVRWIGENILSPALERRRTAA